MLLLNKIKIILTGIICCLLLVESNGAIIINSKENVDIELIGFNQFENFTIEKVKVDVDKPTILETEYKGFALLVYNGGQRYPLIIGKNDLKIKLTSPNIPPKFEDNKEMDFFYDYLSNYRQQQHETMLLNETIKNLGEGDPLVKELDAQKAKVEEDQLALIKTLDKVKYPTVVTVLKAKLLMESTYSIQTIEELDDRKDKMIQYVLKNYKVLQHSDMLLEILKQYYMMNEYVYNSNVTFEETIVKDANRWMNSLKKRISEREVLASIIQVFYNRGMISYASEIIKNNLGLVNGKSAEEIEIDLSDISDYVLEWSKGNNKRKMKDINYIKLISVVSDEDVFSKVETIKLQGYLNDKKSNINLITLPENKLNEGILGMNNLVQGEINYIANKGYAADKMGSNISVPFFIMLDAKNNIIKKATDRYTIQREIDQLKQ